MAISTNQKPTIYRNLYENTGPDTQNVLYFICDKTVYHVKYLKSKYLPGFDLGTCIFSILNLE